MYNICIHLQLQKSTVDANPCDFEVLTRLVKMMVVPVSGRIFCILWQKMLLGPFVGHQKADSVPEESSKQVNALL